MHPTTLLHSITTQKTTKQKSAYT